MTFVVIEFLEDEGGGSVALVCNNWFTPRKTKVLWPPYRKQEHYKSLKAKETPDEHTWEIYKIKKKFFKTDDYQKALHKIKLTEATSDLQSDLGEDEDKPKRKRRAVQKLYDTDESGSENVLPRPPITNLQTTRSHILDAVKKKNPNCSEKDIEDYIKIWLKHSPQCFKADCMRKKKNAAT
ncbi:hypothetical protein FQR65_LT15097 [Abscondita terminalis]|nr:hypothetical protein FQR65_LT15097 [Abscondita terminalis]